MDVWDDPDKYPGSVSEEAEKRFQEHYLRPLGNDARYVRLESGFRTQCRGYVLMSCCYASLSVVRLGLVECGCNRR
jgi:hypothetical protein